jgi:SOS-response transcriptional repressor LexA
VGARLNTKHGVAKRRTRRDEIYDFICAYADEKNGPTPSIREISQSMHLGYSTAYHHILKLIIEGRLEQRDGKLLVVGSEWYGPENF